MTTTTEELQIKTILEFLNKTPEHFLCVAPPGEKVEISGTRCTVVRDNLRGGLLVFCPLGVPRFGWDKENKKWVFASMS
jgi:hypothetical protein